MNMDRYALAERMPTSLRTHNLQLGDLVLFRGSDPVSRAIRDLDGGEFDHCAIVVDIDGDEPTLVDQNFRGFSRWNIGAYEARPEAVLVRRHRIGGHGELFVQRAIEYGNLYPTYAFGRLANIMLVSLVRSLPRIERFSQDQKRRFASRMGAIFTMALAQADKTDTGVCVSLPLYVFDTIPVVQPAANQEHRLVDGPSQVGQFCGLHLEPEDLGGFSRWFSAVQRFCELIAENAADDGSPHPLDQLQKLINGQLDPAHVRADALGCAYDNPTHIDAAAHTIAVGLLDRLLRDRYVVTPRDMERTRSLFDVGPFDLDSVAWKA